jgi:hypothetical protein
LFGGCFAAGRGCRGCRSGARRNGQGINISVIIIVIVVVVIIIIIIIIVIVVRSLVLWLGADQCVDDIFGEIDLVLPDGLDEVLELVGHAQEIVNDIGHSIHSVLDGVENAAKQAPLLVLAATALDASAQLFNEILSLPLGPSDIVSDLRPEGRLWVNLPRAKGRKVVDETIRDSMEAVGDFRLGDEPASDETAGRVSFTKSMSNLGNKVRNLGG